jgi:zinc transporter 1
MKKKGSERDLGMMGVLVHVIGDAINNVGVIIAAAVIWKAKYEGRFYTDPAVSMGISMMILLSSLPLSKKKSLQSYIRPLTVQIVKNSGSILLECVPIGVSLEDVKHDLEKVNPIHHYSTSKTWSS